MFQSVTFFIALRYFWSRKNSGFISFINIFSVVGTMLGVAALIIVTAVMNGFENELKTRVLGIVPHILISGENQRLTDWQQLSTSLQSHSEIVSFAPIVESEALIQSSSQLKGVMFQGVQPALEKIHSTVAQHMLAGGFEQLVPGEYKMILSRSLANQLAIRPGDKARIMVTQASMHTPLGALPAQRMFTLVGVFDLGSEVDDKIVIVHIDDAKRLMRIKQNKVSSLRLFLEDAFAAPNLSRLLQQQLPDSYHINDWQDSQGKLFAAVRMEKSIMALLLGLIVAVAIFNIVSALIMMINDKKSDVAILQTIGLSKQKTARIFLINGSFNGMVGAILGFLLGVVVALNLNQLMALLGLRIVGAPGEGLPVLLVWSQVAFITLGASIMSIAATFYPSWYVSRIQPAKVLREE